MAKTREDLCRQKQIVGCKHCQFYIYGECKRPVIEDKEVCGFEEKKLCTKKCIYFDTCTRNPYRKQKNNEKSLH